eukprot:Seg873.10 transcript_id=Seg873.10/GoldUCD/mRNA.D3Y31 product="hypothetical protein" protein_id=Seg873.10/GoldUCD/D3Y31
MKLVLLATLFVVILLQNEVSGKRHEYKKRSTDDEDEGHFDAKERNIDLKKFDLDVMEEEMDAPKKSPGVIWGRRRCITYFRRRITYCH